MPRRSVSLKIKINLLIVSCLLILLFLLQYNIARQVEATILPLRYRLTNDLVETKGALMGEWLQQRRGDLALIAESLAVLPGDDEYLMDYLNKLLNSRSEIYETFGLVDSAGILSVTDGSRFSIANRKYFKDIERTGEMLLISDPVRSRLNDKDIVVMLCRLPDNSGNYHYLSAAVPIKKLETIAAGINVYDGQGIIIYKKKGPKIEEGRLVFKTAIPASPSWTLEFRISEARMLESGRKLRTGSFITVLLVGTVMILFLSFFSSSIIRPLTRLQDIMKLVEKGETSLRFPIDRNDEMGELGQNLNNMLEEIYRTQNEKKEISLQLMQEQIKPHFLYNTLETIRWMANDYEAQEVVSLVEALSTYFRIGLNQGEPFISIEQELDHIESYLLIQKARYEERLNYQISYENIDPEQKIPRILIQPLIENAIEHGVKYREKGRLKIHLEQKENLLLISVRNDGPGVEADFLEKIQEQLDMDSRDADLMGFGLYSVNHRIRSLYGSPYGLRLCQNDKEFQALLSLPGEWRSNSDV